MTMKKYMLIAAAAIIALSACTKESGIVDKEESRSSDYFTASIEKTDITRATFDAGAKCASWQVGDRINIDGKLYEAQEEGTVTTFAAIGQAAGGSTHKAYFPASLCDAEQNLVLPSTISEEYVEGRFNMPMYAQSTTKDLAFKNLCGVLKITVKSSEIDKVKSIRISSQSRALSGKFTVRDNAAVLTSRLTIANTLEVIYDTAVPLDAEGKVFYIAVPVETYRDLWIDVSNGKDHMVMATKTEAEIAIARNTIYPIVFKGNHYPKNSRGDASTKNDGNKSWVQLWEGGPKFATCNLGANSPQDAGGPFTWGGKIDYRTVSDYSYDGDPYYKTGMDNLSGEDDTAIAIWGPNWRMPTIYEYEEIQNHCYASVTEVNGARGVLLRGKGYFLINSIFLPLVNNWDLDQWVYFNHIMYWTSTAAQPFDNFDYAYAFCINNELQFLSMKRFLRVERQPIRPVLAEEPQPTKGNAPATGYPDGKNWVQLWSGGPKFSERDHIEALWSLTGPDDVAARYWGSNWRVATQDQMDELLKAARGEDSKVSCTLEGLWGSYYFCFRGKEPGYTDNCIYLETSYHDYQLKEYAAYYWSGTSPSEDCGSLMSIYWYNGQPDLRTCNWLEWSAEVYHYILPVLKD